MKLLYRNLIYHRQINFYSFGAVAVCVAIITGALIIGSTLRENLKQSANERLDFVEGVIVSPTSSFDSETAERISSGNNLQATGIKLKSASTINPEDMSRVNRVQLIGIDSSLSEISGIEKLSAPGLNQAIINTELANRLSVKPDDDRILQFSGDNLVAELALYAGEDNKKSWRVTISDIVGPKEFGAFSLMNQLEPVCNIFVNADQLSERLGTDSSRDTLLLKSQQGSDLSVSTEQLIQNLTLSDLGFSILEKDGRKIIKYDGVFIPEETASKVKEQFSELKPFTGYLVNEIVNSSNGLSSSYCFSGTVGSNALSTDSVIINQWLAEDLNAKAGDKLVMDYYLPADQNKLETGQITLTIAEIVPVESVTAMRDLMADIPGMTDSESCSNWQSGVPVDMDKITDRDEQYWDQYRMTPRVVISYELAEKLFAGRYGLATALYSDDRLSGEQEKELALLLREHSKPEIIDAKANADFSVNNSLDFGGLFLALSMFLIASALILPAMLFGLNIENRRSELATLLSLGYTKNALQKLILSEIFIVTALGGLAGIVPGWLYAWGLNYGLSGIFAGALAGYNLELYIDLGTVATGYLATVVLVIVVSIFKCRKILSKTVKSAFSNISESVSAGRKNRKHSLYLGLGFVFASLLMAFTQPIGVASFFLCGTGTLCGGLFICHYLLGLDFTRGKFDRFGLIWHNLSRNQGSTMSVIISLSCGIFMVAAVGLNHYNPMADADKTDGPTGGFNTIGQCSIPITESINSDGEYLAFRVHEGDDASCLNLNRPVSPTILGVDVDAIADIAPFSFAKVASNQPENWSILTASGSDTGGVLIPAVTDYNTIMWALHKSVGSILEIKDQSGNEARLLLSAGLNHSVLQGKMIISEEEFKKLYPNDNGYKLLLFNRPDEKLESQLEDYGCELRSTTDVIGELYQVENTYMSMFALLGGLGLIMGNVVLGFAVLRNIKSRQREFAIMQALGFSNKETQRLVRSGYQIPIMAAVITGVVSAAFGVSRQLVTNISNLPISMVSIILITIIATAFLAVHLATRKIITREIIGTLKNK